LSAQAALFESTEKERFSEHSPAKMLRTEPNDDQDLTSMASTKQKVPTGSNLYRKRTAVPDINAESAIDANVWLSARPVTRK
jgi:hypothetical protein